MINQEIMKPDQHQKCLKLSDVQGYNDYSCAVDMIKIHSLKLIIPFVTFYN